jgi:hypothetical protein
MKYNIGIDIDGVLTDEGDRDNNIWLQKMNEFFNRKITLKEHTYDLRKAFGLTDQELNDFLEIKLPEVYANVGAAPGAKETLEELNQAGHKLILITARNEIFRDLTENWLEKHQIPYHELHHNDDKAPLAVKKDIFLFIDDRKENAAEIAAENIPVILVNKYHNLNFQSSNNILKADNWNEIRKNIKLLLSKNTPAGKFS